MATPINHLPQSCQPVIDRRSQRHNALTEGRSRPPLAEQLRMLKPSQQDGPTLLQTLCKEPPPNRPPVGSRQGFLLIHE
eukprot:4817402-Amphidinium_carterae.1